MRFRDYLWDKYKLKRLDVYPLPMPGYWKMKNFCKGPGGCSNTAHNTVKEPMQHLIFYSDRFKDIKLKGTPNEFATWKRNLAAYKKKQSGMVNRENL